MWRLKLEDAQKEEDRHHLCIRNDGNGQHINEVLPESNIKEILEFLTRALFIPVKSTLLRAAKNGNFATWPSLTEKNITKFLAKPEAEALGHMDQAHKNNCSKITTEHTDYE